LIGVGFYYDRGAMMEATLTALREFFQAHVHGIRRFGAASLDLCSVAMGMFGAYFEYQLSPWDFAAGSLIVEEAGGKVTTCGGEPLPLARTTLLASNGALHQAALAIVQRNLPYE
jgi:myo-inositol-1(or 4)-monophosphatase